SAKSPYPVDHDVVHDELAHEAGEEREVDVHALRGSPLVQGRAVVGATDLAPLVAMPGMIGVLVVRTEEHVEHGLAADAMVLTELRHVRERRRGQDAVEVEQDGVESSRHGAAGYRPLTEGGRAGGPRQVGGGAAAPRAVRRG